MQTVEIRRHTVRIKPTEQLSEEGTALAHELGDSLGPFDLVISSARGRALATVAALGFAADRTEPLWTELGEELEREVPWPSPFAAYRGALERGGATTSRAREMRQSIRDALSEIPDPGAVLIVTHGGVPELAAVALAPTWDATALGGPIRCLEGVRLKLRADGAVVGLEVLRWPADRSRL